MSKQKGIVFFEGTMGGINFYFRKGVPTARAAGGGFNRETIKNSPKMVRVRENNAEFKGCSVTNKLFKQAIRPFFLDFKDGSLHSRLMRLFLKVKDCDLVSERGKRIVAEGMATMPGVNLLMAFEFTPKRSRLLPCSYGFDWDLLVFEITGFETGRFVFPDEADYFELLFGVVQFDFQTGEYSRVMASPLVIDRDFVGDSFTVSLPELPEGSSMFFAVGSIAFYQTVNGFGYRLSTEALFGFDVISVRS